MWSVLCGGHLALARQQQYGHCDDVICGEDKPEL